jgi:hypothetical protein
MHCSLPAKFSWASQVDPLWGFRLHVPGSFLLRQVLQLHVAGSPRKCSRSSSPDLVGLPDILTGSPSETYYPVVLNATDSGPFHEELALWPQTRISIQKVAYTM